jgi:hypothetical protein
VRFWFKLTSLLIAILIVGQSFQYAVVTYFFYNHNEVLVESCCVNKGIDDSCQAKCFLDKSQKQQEEHSEVSLKKVEYVVQNTAVKVEKPYQTQFIVPQKNASLYDNLYSFLYNPYTFQPPSLG